MSARLVVWQTLTAQIESGGHDELQQLYAQRDAIWGHNASDASGVWYWLGMYKKGALDDYHFGVETMYPDSTYAQTLPRIFPAQASDKEPPRFAYNRVAGAGGVGVTVEFNIALGSLATLCFLKAGDFEQVKPIVGGMGCKHIEFENVHIVDGIDRLGPRDEANKIVGSGLFDESFMCVRL